MQNPMRQKQRLVQPVPLKKKNKYPSHDSHRQITLEKHHRNSAIIWIYNPICNYGTYITEKRNLAGYYTKYHKEINLINF